jgi:hypothetical protein
MKYSLESDFVSFIRVNAVSFVMTKCNQIMPEMQ